MSESAPVVVKDEPQNEEGKESVTKIEIHPDTIARMRQLVGDRGD